MLELALLTQKMSFVRFNTCRIRISTWNLFKLHIRANARKVAPLSLVLNQQWCVVFSRQLANPSLTCGIYPFFTCIFFLRFVIKGQVSEAQSLQKLLETS